MGPSPLKGQVPFNIQPLFIVAKRLPISATAKHLCVYLGLTICVFFSFTLDYFVLVLFAVVVLDLDSSVLRQEIGWEERPWNDPFCVEWDIKPKLDQSFNSFHD